MKRIILHIFFILFLTFTFANKVFSQMPTLASQTWTCMRGEPQGITFNSVSNSTVSQELYADGYTINGDAYIVSCVGTVARRSLHNG